MAARASEASGITMDGFETYYTIRNFEKRTILDETVM
jgi:hypothetical protein